MICTVGENALLPCYGEEYRLSPQQHDHDRTRNRIYVQNSGATKAMALRLKNGRDLPSIGRLLPEEGFPPVATGRTCWHMQRVLIIISGLPGRPAPEPTHVRIFSALHCKAQHSQSKEPIAKVPLTTGEGPTALPCYGQGSQCQHLEQSIAPTNKTPSLCLCCNWT